MNHASIIGGANVSRAQRPVTRIGASSSACESCAGAKPRCYGSHAWLSSSQHWSPAGRSRVYQSRASLEIQGFNENFLSLRDIYPTAASAGDAAMYVQTQVELLQQDSLIEQVGRKLHLEGRPEFQPPSTSLSKLRRHIRIVPLRNSRIIQIVCDAHDARLAADVANTVAQTFIEQTIEARQKIARQTYESLRLQLDELRPGLLRPEARAAKTGPDGPREPLLRKLDTDRRLYASLLEKANDARLASGVRQSNIRLIGPAEPATRPYKPSLPLNLIIGTLGGLMVAIGYVMLQEQHTSVLNSPGEAGMHLALPELGAIPDAGAWKSASFGSGDPSNGNLHVERAVLERRSSYLSESFRTTLASILSTPHQWRAISQLRVHEFPADGGQDNVGQQSRFRPGRDRQKGAVNRRRHAPAAASQDLRSSQRMGFE